MVNPEDFGLQSQPFQTLATDASTKHWAGMPEAKQILEDIVISVLPEDIGEREFAIMHGPWGGGKTHALGYFAREIAEKNYGHAFFVRKVLLGPKPNFLELFRAIIHENSQILPDLVTGVVRAVKQEKNRLAHEDKAYLDLNDDDFLQKIIDDADHSDQKDLIRSIMKKFHDAKSSSKPNVEEIVRLLTAVKDEYSAVIRLASLIGVMTTPIGKQAAPYKAAYVFFDEVEEVLRVSYNAQLPFWGAFRELVNRTAGYRCGIILAFSEGAAALEAQLEPFLLERITRPFIHMQQLSDESAKKFIVDYLQAVRTGKSAPKQPFSPFSTGAIEFIIEKNPEIVPRKILMSMGRIFKRATRRSKISSPEEEISREIAEECWTEMGL